MDVIKAITRIRKYEYRWNPQKPKNGSLNRLKQEIGEKVLEAVQALCCRE